MIKCKEKGFRILNVPVELLASENFTANEKLVYMAIYGLSYQKGMCWAGNRGIGKQIGANEKTVQRSINKLLKHGYIHKSFKITKLGRTRLLTTSELYLHNNKENIQVEEDVTPEIFEYDWLGDPDSPNY